MDQTYPHVSKQQESNVQVVNLNDPSAWTYTLRITYWSVEMECFSIVNSTIASEM
ncbi:hypothetical protein [Dyadobacter sp. CY326]|uniref:hypothetical protein n=1 Tax=Dyadobacter sp. CY326 TaxID=2907300 RepID=UPI001F32A0D3|nr:hypothetical protein [Dyadobacter sp. CY326]MCE7067972.1 hypothetical protein [Dyadobacter sp. CY326]